MCKELISIIIPAYNSQKYIADCLKATLAQTYRNIEVYVVDDGSTDNTVKIVEKCSNSDNRVKLIKLEHGGVSNARNVGISLSRGKYVCFFDSDDYPNSDIIEKYVRTIEESKKYGKTVALIMCGMYCDNQYNFNVENTVQILENWRGFNEKEYYVLKRNMIADLCWLNLFNFVTNKFYSLEAINKFNLFFKEDIHNGEDLLFNLEYLDVVEGDMGFINEPLYHYVKREKKSLSLTYYEGAIEDTKKIYNKLIDFSKKQYGTTEDDIMVLKSLLLRDWTSRLTALFGDNRYDRKTRTYIPKANINTHEFKELLKEVRKVKKVSKLRYLALRTGSFWFYYSLRHIYQIIKR